MRISMVWTLDRICKLMNSPTDNDLAKAAPDELAADGSRIVR